MRKAIATASPTAPRGCTNFKLRQLTRRVGQHYDRVVAASGLKTTQYSLLAQIEHLGPVRPSDLAAAMTMDASTLTRNLQPLVANGWAEIGPGADGRSRLVALTARGRAKRLEAQRDWKRAQLALNERLGAGRVAELHALLDDCLATLSDPELEHSDA
jgi:DNA-binding MarR family transcriptional regulator